MANLAIKGHATRGKEVIEILEMLGGKNIHNYDGTFNECYVIDHKKICTIYTSVAKIDGFVIITLEEFLKKFRHKVGDKVLINDDINDVYTIKSMIWDADLERVVYKIEAIDGIENNCNWFADEMERCLEQKETMEEINITRIGFNGDKAKLILPDGYEIKTEDKEVYVAKKKPQYPKTYEECCEVLGIDVSRTIGHSEDLLFYRDVTCYENNLLSSLAVLRKLLICRDAYWKIAGDWKPDFLNPTREIRYFLFCTGITIEKGQGLFPTNKILIFPTEEMRDVFFENFKDLIEQCKELL